MAAKTFKIPLETEVRAYMAERKPDWPKMFINYYAEKFYNYYMANGWVQGKGKPLKSWQAAFISNWQNLKWEEDMKELNKYVIKENGTPSKEPKSNVWQRLDQLGLQCMKDSESIDKATYFKVYEWLKERGLIQLDKYQEQLRDEITSRLENKEQQEKILTVKMVFQNISGKGKTFVELAKQKATL